MIRRERDARFVLITPEPVPRWREAEPGDPELYELKPPLVRVEPDDPPPPPYYALTRGGGNVWIIGKTEGEALVNAAQVEPQLLVEEMRRVWWLYHDRVYSTQEDLEPDEVQALVEEKENKKRLQIARAKTVAAMADNLDRKGQRQAIPKDVKVLVWQRDRGACVQCGSNVGLEFDHIVPLALGGANTFRNLQLLCQDCNREKGPNL